MDEIAYDKWHRNLQVSSGRQDPLTFAWHRAAARNIGHYPRGSLLEVGCGRGEFAWYLVRTFPELVVTAVDFSETAIEFARQNQDTSAVAPRFLVGNAMALPFDDQSFDWVVSCECLEHVEDPQKMTNELHRVLKPGGRFCLTTENYFNATIISWVHCWLTGRPFDSGSGVQPRENFFLFWKVKQYLRRAGLQVGYTESCHYQWLLLPRVDPARLCFAEFRSPTGRMLGKPFGRHYTFCGTRPA
jgi:ubiquinone/menaquinone biosynthesis C-methylase UbiE